MQARIVTCGTVLSIAQWCGRVDTEHLIGVQVSACTEFEKLIDSRSVNTSFPSNTVTKLLQSKPRRYQRRLSIYAIVDPKALQNEQFAGLDDFGPDGVGEARTYAGVALSPARRDSPIPRGPAADSGSRKVNTMSSRNPGSWGPELDFSVART
ncbi:hypothetical protein evm_008500 [Chilo suppressalis]|nr:hypothetical protein evm_008500 [Chilo suppressalis]